MCSTLSHLANYSNIFLFFPSLRPPKKKSQPINHTKNPTTKATPKQNQNKRPKTKHRKCFSCLYNCVWTTIKLEKMTGQNNLIWNCLFVCACLSFFFSLLLVYSTYQMMFIHFFLST